MSELADFIDMSEYKELFASEAQEHLETIDSGLLILERDPEDTHALERIFRAAHTLKGMAATMGYQELAQVAHALEDLLDELREGRQVLSPALADLLFAGVDALKTLLADVLADRPASLDTQALVQRLRAPTTGAADEASRAEPPGAPTEAAPPAEPATTPREESEPPPPAEEVPRAPQAPQIPQTIRISTQHLDALLNLVAELVISRSRLWRIQQRHSLPDLREALEQHDRLLGDLRDAVLQTRMVPVAQVFNRFPRMVRDLLRERGKEADFIVEGGDIELDRTILERVSDPLLHLLRNAVDHGIEPPAERERLGKPRRGTIRLCARRERESVVIEVMDDGQGMDRDRILETAIRRGVIEPAEAEELSDHQALMLICHPGFSTARRVTDLSGRGVGMDVVRRQIESLHGSLYIETEPGRGTTFRLRLPLTLAIIQALLVKTGPEMYAIPLSQVEHILEIEPEQVKQVQRWRVTTDEEAKILPLLELRELLEVPENGPIPSLPGYAVIVGEDHGRVGLVVDDLLGQEEIVIRPLPPALRDIPGLAGASILGEGQVVLILDAPNLVQIPVESI
jgi:two-component system chemotaxis sensor kinase CheA